MIVNDFVSFRCSEKNYNCPECRPSDTQPPHLLPSSPSPVTSSSPHPNLHHHLHNTSSHSSASSGGLVSSINASIGALPGTGSRAIGGAASLGLSGGCLSLTASNQPSLGYTASSGLSIGAVDSPTRSDSPCDLMPKSNSKADHWLDGVCLSDSGMILIKNMILEPLKQRRHHQHKMNRPVRGPSLDSCGSRGDLDDDDDGDDEGEPKECVEEPKHWVYGLKEGTIIPAQVRSSII